MTNEHTSVNNMVNWEFQEDQLPHVLFHYSGDDMVALREEFMHYKNYLSQLGRITGDQYDNIYFIEPTPEAIIKAYDTLVHFLIKEEKVYE